MPKMEPKNSTERTALQKETGAGISDNVELVNTKSEEAGSDDFTKKDGEKTSAHELDHEHEPPVRSPYFCSEN